MNNIEAEVTKRMANVAAKFAKVGFRTAEQESQEHRAAVDALRLAWDAPRRHTAQVLHLNPPDGWSKAMEALRAGLGNGLTSALVGINGPGKTQIGVELMKTVTENERPALYTTAMRFFTGLKETYGDGSKLNESAVIKRFCKPSLLVIDEVQERGQSGWEDRMLAHLVNERYNALSDTLLISNLKRSEFDASLGRSIVDRLNETGGVIECNWGSFRA